MNTSRIARAVQASVFLSTVGLAAPAAAQTDFYNTDRGRPLRTEDAIVIERRAVEIQAAPLSFTRVARGSSLWGIAPELAWGFAPRTQVELAFPVAIVDDGSRPRALTALAGAELELLHQLNAESRTLPALAVGAGAHLPVGPLAPDRTITSIRALATRTLGWGRVHLNGQYTPGEALGAGAAGADEATRWSAGIALDHTFAFRSLLVGAEVTAQEALVDGAPTEWRSAIGIRQQLSPRFAFDAGLARRISEGDAGWSLTMGAAYAIGQRGVRGFTGGTR